MTNNHRPSPFIPNAMIAELTANALKEDLGRSGDITTNSIFKTSTMGVAKIFAREKGILAGIPFAEAAFTQLSTDAKIKWFVSDGSKINGGDCIAEIKAPVQTILTGERTALNFLGHLSGIATKTREFVELVRGTNAKIADTRKTTPGLRSAEKYAVRLGGGTNHRMGLDDAILIKDNHIAFAGGIADAITSVKKSVGHLVKIEIEVDNLNQLEECLLHEIDAVLLDNMLADQLKKAVQIIDGRIIAEASGGVTLETVAAIAATGVDIISIGALTHSSTSLDYGLDVDIPKR